MSSQIASTSRTIIQASRRSAAVARRNIATSPVLGAEPSSTSSSLPAAYQRADAVPASTPSNTKPSLAQRTTSFGGIGAVSHPYRLNVFSTRNNTILTLTTTPTASANELYHPVAWVSAGSAGYKGAARGTYDAAVEVSLRMFKKLADLVNPPILAGGQRLKVTTPRPTEVEIVWKGFGQGRDAVLRTLLSGEGDAIRGLVQRVTDAVSYLSFFFVERLITSSL